MVDGTRVRTYFHRSLSGHEKGYIDSTAGYLKKFSETVGKYPYSAFHIISSPLPVGYGFPYLTYMGENVLRLPFIRYTSLGHEVLHSWWGNGVYIDYEKGNWAEGLTTYMADYAFETARGGGKALEKRLGWLRDYAALPKGRDRAISSFTSKSHTASQVIGYNKVAYLFHMLKIEIGEEAFDRAIKRFWRDNKGKKAGWPAVEQAFARESKRDLGWFFDQWLNQVGAPKLTLKSVQYSAGKTTIRLVQIPSDYRLSVPVRLSGEGWSQTELVTLSEAEASFSFTTEKKPNTVAIDPGFDIFRRLDAAEAPAILRDVTLSDLVKVVILGDDKVFISAGNQLARRMLDARAQSFSATDSPDEDDVLLIIGHPSAVSNYLEKHFQTGRPSEIASTGTARAWAEKPPGRKAIAVVEADDHAALKALLRPLPHYGRKGYVVFNGAKATVKGMWQPKRSPLIKTLN